MTVIRCGCDIDANVIVLCASCYAWFKDSGQLRYYKTDIPYNKRKERVEWKKKVND